MPEKDNEKNEEVAPEENTEEATPEQEETADVPAEEEQPAEELPTTTSSKKGKKIKDSSYWGQKIHTVEGVFDIGKDGIVNSKDVAILSKYFDLV